MYDPSLTDPEDREAFIALHTAAVSRMEHAPRTRARDKIGNMAGSIKEPVSPAIKVMIDEAIRLHQLPVSLELNERISQLIASITNAVHLNGNVINLLADAWLFDRVAEILDAMPQPKAPVRIDEELLS